MHTVQLTSEQHQLITDLLHQHYNTVSDGYWNHELGPEYTRKAQSTTYKSIIALRLSEANKAWKEYTKQYPDKEWRAYSSKQEFLKDQFTIYPSDLK